MASVVRKTHKRRQWLKDYSALPSGDSSDDAASPHYNNSALFEQLAEEFAAENARQAAIDEEADAKETGKWKQWIEKPGNMGYVQLNVSYSDPVVDEMRIGWEQEAAEAPDSIDDLTDLQDELLQMRRPRKADYASSHVDSDRAGREFYGELKAHLSPKTLRDPNRFERAVARTKEYLSSMQKTQPDTLASSEFAEGIAAVVSKHQAALNGSEGIRTRFEMLVSDVALYAPKLYHALNTAQAFPEATYAEPEAQSGASSHKNDSVPERQDIRARPYSPEPVVRAAPTNGTHQEKISLTRAGYMPPPSVASATGPLGLPNA